MFISVSVNWKNKWVLDNFIFFFSCVFEIMFDLGCFQNLLAQARIWICQWKLIAVK